MYLYQRHAEQSGTSSRYRLMQRYFTLAVT
jgi:hypothetical protein